MHACMHREKDRSPKQKARFRRYVVKTKWAPIHPCMHMHADRPLKNKHTGKSNEWTHLLTLLSLACRFPSALACALKP